MHNGEGEEHFPPHLEVKDGYFAVYGDNGQSFRIKADLYGNKLPGDSLNIVGRVDEENADLKLALQSGWIDSEGNFTEAGKAEMERRKARIIKLEAKAPTSELSSIQAPITVEAAKNGATPQRGLRLPASSSRAFSG